MSSTTIIFLLLMGTAILVTVLRRTRRTRHGGSDPAVTQRLRQTMLETMPEQVVAGQPGLVIMDMGYPGATASLMASHLGDASIYISTGGGVIGGVGHERVRTAAIHFVRESANFLDRLTPTGAFPYPGAGEVRFYVRTPEAVYTGGAAESALGKKQDPLWPLFYAGQNVITELRQVSPQPGK